MPAARVSPASIVEVHHQPRTSFNAPQNRREYDRHPPIRAVNSKHVALNRKQHSQPLFNSRQDGKGANGKLSQSDLIKSEKGKQRRRTWLSFAKRYREWSARYDNSPRVGDFYGQFHPQPSFNFPSCDHRVQSVKFCSPSKPLDSEGSTESSNLTHPGNDAFFDNEVGSHSSLQFIHSSNCVPSTEPNGHSSNIRISKNGRKRGSPDPGSSSSCQTSDMSPYERIVKCISQNDSWRRELTLGRRIGFYRIRGDIGSGNFSQVKVASHCLTGEKVAIKILDKSKLDSKTQTMLTREIGAMEKLHHPNLVQLFEVIENFSKIHLVLEFAAGGELYQKISNQGKLIEPVAKSLFAQIISAIDHMHRHHIIHRDIKAENVFFSDPETVKVGDFGFSTEVESKSDLLNTYCGSPPYAAPELFSDECYIGPPVDLWACGVLLFFMVTSQMPFKAATVTALKKLILDGDFIIPDYVSVECSWLIRSLLQRDPINRLDTRGVHEDKWLKGLSFPQSLPRYKYTRTDVRTNEFNQDSNKADPDNGEVTDLTGTTAEETETREGTSVLSKEEKEAIECLKKLGISEEMLIANQVKGARSSITGIYRITIHRIISGKHFKHSNTQDHSRHESKKNPPSRSSPSTLHKRSVEREINTIQSDGPNGQSESSSSSRGGENEVEKSSVEKVVKIRKGSNNNLMRMAQIFTDSEGYIMLPCDQLSKTSEINPDYVANGDGKANGQLDQFKQQMNRSAGGKVPVNSSHLHEDMKGKKDKKSWKKRLVSCCVS